MMLQNVISIFKVLLVRGLFFVLFFVQAQEIPPYFKDFSKEDYLGENPNWSITQGKDGVIYSANNHFLLSYDGGFWKKHQLPNKTIIRSVNVINDTLYTGSYKEFGYWTKKKGSLKYNSLSKVIDERVFNNDEIWKILPYKDAIIFQSFNHLFIYDKASKRISTIKLDFPAIFCYTINDTIYITTRKQGIYKLENNKLTLLEWSKQLGEKSIHVISSFKGGILIGTEFEGIYYYRNNRLTKWSISDEEMQINHLSVIDNEVYVGTVNKGLLVFHENGTLKYILDKKNGLQNNTILNQFIDAKKNLWLGLDNGLSVVFPKSNISMYIDSSGDLGTVFDIEKDPTSTNLVIGTNHGIFILKNNHELKFVEGSNGQVWSLKAVGNRIICGHNTGTFSLENETLTKISPHSGGRAFKKIPNTRNQYLQPNYGGVTLFYKANNTWGTHQFNEAIFPSKDVLFDYLGNVWVNTTFEGIHKYNLSKDLKKLTLVKAFDKDEFKKSFCINNDLILKGNNNLFRYDTSMDTLIKHPIIEKKIVPYNNIISINNGAFLMKEYKETYTIYHLLNNRSFTFNKELFSNRILKGYPNSKMIDNHLYLFIDDGFIKINPLLLKQEKKINPPVIHALLKEKVYDKNTFNLEIPYNKNEIKFFFSNNDVFPLNNLSYKYKLVGYDNSWKEVINQPKVSFPNLPRGNYVFKVKAIYNNHIESNEESFEFSVLPPWYLTSWAYILYVVFLVSVSLIINQYSKIKYHRKKETLKKKEELNSELKFKNKELAIHALHMVKKDETLQKIKQILDRSDIKRENKRLYNELISILDKQKNLKEWDFFEKNLSNLHEDFFYHLQNLFPSLSQKDLKLCAYLKMNLSSKEIAPLLRITYRSVELHRYRLRKKMNLGKTQNLVKFLMNQQKKANLS